MKISFNLLSLTIAAALVSAPVAFGDNAVAAPVKAATSAVSEMQAVMEALATTNVAAAKSALAQQVGASTASARYLAAFGMLHAGFKANKAEIAALQTFVEENMLTTNQLMDAVTELAKTKKTVSLANIQSTNSISSYVVEYQKSRKTAATQVASAKSAAPGPRIGTDGEATAGVDLSAEGQVAFYLNLPGLSGKAEEQRSRLSSCDTTACTVEKRHLGRVAAAASRACDSASLKGMPNCRQVAMQGFQSWAAGTYAHLLAPSQADAAGGTEFAEKVFTTQLNYRTPAEIIKGFANVSADALTDTLGYYDSNPQMKLCMQGREPVAGDAVAAAH